MDAREKFYREKNVLYVVGKRFLPNLEITLVCSFFLLCTILIIWLGLFWMQCTFL